ncbi:MAG: transketolase C-terminal domain-containing protein [Deltaproteobacteria bacterium]|jgi:pyruvate/2-oxoacid:ferredoxin oxidoreductase alpha subunit|nr:transketolase C-terminal domain-containing protein [Deltaproteobacteria bacterium]MDO9210486.1 transketolase C-terminal domain-containing protein [Deltaproteobacteria bacterium]MDP3041012.1 transketolase C-terminal domain-containing protein [Deltaproteobacteria bacterium]
MKKIMVGNHAVSWGVMLARAEVIPAYPITPQTTIVEELSVLCADGRLKAKFIPVESEHSAMACCVGASAAGVRTFTATSGQGLALMHEMLHWASGARLPIVMANVNRALGSPWNIWGEQTDSLSQRDTGWLQLYCESNQEVLDTTIQAFKIAEEIHLPVMLNLDAFFLSHTAEPVEIPEQKRVDDFLPRYQPEFRLDPKKPYSFGCLTPPEYFMEFRYKIQQSMLQGKEVSRRVDEEFGQSFGRKYGLIEAYRCDGADLILVTSGAIASTARVVVDALRQKGRKVGMVKVRLFRPFPQEELYAVLRDVEKVAVVDRNVSFGVGGIFAHELNAAFCNEKTRPPIFSYIAGLGGRDVTPQVLNDVVYQTYKRSQPEKHSVWVGMRNGP